MTAIGTNPERTRSYNRRLVLDVVRLHGPLSRTDIAARTDLTLQTVSNITGGLMREGLLVGQGRRRSGRGQPPMQVAINPSGGHTLGFEIQTDRITGVLVDLVGEERARRQIDLPEPTPDRALPALAAERGALAAAAGVDPIGLIGAGIVMPGPFGVESLNAVGPAALPGWSAIDARAALAGALGTDVVVENDATAAAVGERLYGVARAYRTFCFLYFGSGLGLGLVLDGRPYKGAMGNAGEIGHVVVDPGGRPCFCGNRGCLEGYVSLPALRQHLAAAGIHASDPAALERLAAQGDAALSGWINQAGLRLRLVIGLLENLFDPETVLIGGALPPALIRRLIEAASPLPATVACRNGRAAPRLMPGTTGRATAALGAAALPLFNSVTPELALAARPAQAVASR